VDTGLWTFTAPAGVLGWGEVTEAGLVALTVVEDLDELEQVGTGGVAGLKPDPGGAAGCGRSPA
jgi:hypothetical protein